MPLKPIIILLALLISFQGISQKKSEKIKKVQPEKKKEEVQVPENIETFSKNFLIRGKFIYPTVSINVSDRSRFRKGKKFMYLPAMPGVVGFALKIKKVYVSAAVQLPASEALKRKYGTSKFRDININIQGRVVQWGLFYRDYQGFYLNNYEPHYPGWNRDSLGFPRTAGLRVREMGLNLGFNFNKSFSLNAAFAQGERQKKSAGSFLLGLSPRFQRIDADSNFVPPGQEAYYPNLHKLKYGNFITSLISFGAGYQFVVKKFHFTPVVMAGTGVQIQNFRQTYFRHTRLNIPTYLNAKAQVGYNGDHFFVNLIYQTEFNSIPIRESRVRLFHNWLEAGMGLRF
jgi:hypothetical protein